MRRVPISTLALPLFALACGPSPGTATAPPPVPAPRPSQVTAAAPPPVTPGPASPGGLAIATGPGANSRGDRFDRPLLAAAPNRPPCSGVGDHLFARAIQASLPRIAWTGSHYAFAYFARRKARGPIEAFFGLTRDPGKRSARPRQVSPGGEALSLWPRFAQGPDGFAVTYLDDRGPRRQVYFARLDAAGVLIPGSEVQVSRDTAGVHNTAVVWDPKGRRYAIVWSGVGGVHVRRFEVDGAATDQVGIVIGGGSLDYTGTPAIWAGDRIAVVTASPVRVLEVMPDGTKGQSYIFEHAGMRPSIAWAGDQYGVVWQSGGQLSFARVGPSGLVPDSEVTLDTGPHAGEADIAWSGADFGVTWSKGSAQNPADVWFARVSPVGEVSDLRPLTTSPKIDWWPSITYCGQYVVVYENGLARFGQDGHLRMVFP